MTNHWNTELDIITLGRKAASPYMGQDTDNFIKTVADALRAIEMCIEERDNLMEESFTNKKGDQHG
jgi:Holliday junction resolvase RusA-like endonuclease